MKYQLKILKKFQEKYPKSHVGGSIGLHMHGVDLKRNLIFSDLDIVTPEFTEKKDGIDHGCSPVEDFDYRYQIDHPQSGLFFKIEIRIDDTQSEYDIINFNGVNFNVTKKETILHWKQKYAEKGHQKHIDDLITIATGIRPKNKELNFS